MMDERGLTLLEALLAATLALTLVAAGAALFLSMSRMSVYTSGQSSGESQLFRVFYLLEQDLEDIVISVDEKKMVNLSSPPVLCTEPSESAYTNIKVQYQQKGSPCVMCYTYTVGSTIKKRCELQFNKNERDNDGNLSGVTTTFIYRYEQEELASLLYQVNVIREKYSKKIDPVTSAKTYSSLTSTLTDRVFAYASADLNASGDVTEAERIARDICLDAVDASAAQLRVARYKTPTGGSPVKVSPLDPANCWLKDSDAVYPFFSLAPPDAASDLGMLQVSGRGRFGKPGVTKTFMLRKVKG